MTPLTPPAAASPSLPLGPVFADMGLTSDEQLVAPSPGSSIKRPPGRPAGRPTQDLRHGRLGIHHFAFLRAWLSGFDLAEAWDRYLSFQGENKDLRHIRAVRVRLWIQVLADAQALNASLPCTWIWLNLMMRLRRQRRRSDGSSTWWARGASQGLCRSPMDWSSSCLSATRQSML